MPAVFLKSWSYEKYHRSKHAFDLPVYKEQECLSYRINYLLPIFICDSLFKITCGFLLKMDTLPVTSTFFPLYLFISPKSENLFANSNDLLIGIIVPLWILWPKNLTDVWNYFILVADNTNPFFLITCKNVFNCLKYWSMFSENINTLSI